MYFFQKRIALFIRRIQRKSRNFRLESHSKSAHFHVWTMHLPLLTITTISPLIRCFCCSSCCPSCCSCCPSCFSSSTACGHLLLKGAAASVAAGQKDGPPLLFGARFAGFLPTLTTLAGSLPWHNHLQRLRPRALISCNHILDAFGNEEALGGAFSLARIMCLAY